MALQKCITALNQGGYHAEVGQMFDSTHEYVVKYPANFSATAAAHTYPGSGNMFDAVAADLLINVRTDSLANAVADIVTNLKSIADNLNQVIAG